LIDPDAIAREINPVVPGAVAAAAGREALSRASNYILEGADFVQETTMSGNSTARLIDRAKAAGYEIDLRYVGLESATLSKARVLKRFSTGGHSVPAKDIERRYERSLRALPGIFAKVDFAALYDNSDATGHRIFARFEAGKLISLEPHVPAWAANSITT
jgi:predicted ABC-type ATPase